MSLSTILMANIAAIVIMFFLLWVASLFLRDVSIVDRFWGVGFMLIAWMTIASTDDPHGRALLIVSLVTIWGIRLSSYLTWRNWGHGEDRRYGEMRDRNGNAFMIMSLCKVFGLQAILLWFIALPIQAGIVHAASWPMITFLGLLLWIIGFTFESVGDWQLAQFKADPKNKGCVMSHGLWRYTRHPNYFGEFLLWWGLYLIAFDATSWWWTILGPALLSFLLLRVSGVTMLEASLRDRLEGYEDYLRVTSTFIPWPFDVSAAACYRSPDTRYELQT